MNRLNLRSGFFSTYRMLRRVTGERIFLTLLAISWGVMLLAMLSALILCLNISTKRLSIAACKVPSIENVVSCPSSMRAVGREFEEIAKSWRKIMKDIRLNSDALMINFEEGLALLTWTLEREAILRKLLNQADSSPNGHLLRQAANRLQKRHSELTIQLLSHWLNTEEP